MMNSGNAPFRLLTALFGDAPMAKIFSLESAISGWLRVEVALAEAQAEIGILTPAEAAAIRRAAIVTNVDIPRLLRESRIVGYPILPLIREITPHLDDGRAARLHYGATTQDIMDTALAMQLVSALARLSELVETFGAALARHIEAHRSTAIMGRTHAQHATPTTFGAKLAVFLGELSRHRERLAEARDRVGKVSLYGAAGTSAALGDAVPQLRRSIARALGLQATDVPWHVARDSIAEFGNLSAMIAATCARFAREVIDLARTEVGEVREQGGYHRGASSTMPQKSNPIASEAIIGMASSAGAMAGALYRAMEANHERSAGEWQIEWQIVPDVACLSASCVALAADIAGNLEIHPEVMLRNLESDGGFVMAEAYMMRLAPALGREAAHDLVYSAVQDARRDGRALYDQLRSMPGAPHDLEPIGPMAYLGQAAAICDAALAAWRRAPDAAELSSPPARAAVL
jgi:3-carboxy-cis,cis-muconate cycloisomerase